MQARYLVCNSQSFGFYDFSFDEVIKARITFKFAK